MTSETEQIDPDRVRANTIPAVLHKIDSTIEERVRYYATQPKHVITTRIEQLDQEWDIERWLETNASSLALGGVLLGLVGRKKWLFVSGAVLSFLLLHAIQGWCPPVPALRRMGIRTRGEIDREKFALKVLRGDFQDVSDVKPPEFKENSANKVLSAISA